MPNVVVVDRAIRSLAMDATRATARDPVITSRIMSAVSGRDTKPELALRSELHKRGLRFRVNYRGLIGRPDIVFAGPHVAVFVDGDFFHGHSWKARGFASFDDQFNHRNADFWRAKIERNVERDREVSRALRRDGWMVVRVWESDVLRNVSRAADRVERAVRSY
jgi:DNA mismatch endonuclease, patch repair protein